jgi:hypothetical protein
MPVTKVGNLSLLKSKNMKKSLLIAIFLIYCSFFVMNAQTIDNVKASVQDNNIVLTYNIKNAQYGQKFNIELWYSANNSEYKKCQTINCSDGTNIDITAGDNKKITWFVLKDLTRLEANTIDFEVRAVVNSNTGGNRRR